MVNVTCLRLFECNLKFSMKFRMAISMCHHRSCLVTKIVYVHVFMRLFDLKVNHKYVGQIPIIEFAGRVCLRNVEHRYFAYFSNFLYFCSFKLFVGHREQLSLVQKQQLELLQTELQKEFSFHKIDVWKDALMFDN